LERTSWRLLVLSAEGVHNLIFVFPIGVWFCIYIFNIAGNGRAAA
jgi:hypothetical protein